MKEFAEKDQKNMAWSNPYGKFWNWCSKNSAFHSAFSVLPRICHLHFETVSVISNISLTQSFTFVTNIDVAPFFAWCMVKYILEELIVFFSAVRFLTIISILACMVLCIRISINLKGGHKHFNCKLPKYYHYKAGLVKNASRFFKTRNHLWKLTSKDFSKPKPGLEWN